MPQDVTGELLGRHHCLERLGDGPLGVTYRARVYGIGEFVKEFALTAVDRDLCEDPGFRDRLVAAANRAAQLGGERLQRLFEVEQSGPRWYLVSELVAGVELGLLLELLRATGEPLGVAPGALIALEAAEALAGAHARTELDPMGVLHLGLSPKTVVVDESGETRILHTGLYSSLLRPGWDPRRLPRSFLAPEVLAGGPAIGSADVFSVGQLLHEAVGFLPDAERLRPVIRRATDPDPRRRFPTMMDLWAAIEPHCDRAAGRARLADLAARYGVKAPPLERPTAVEVPLLLPEPRAPRSDWETSEIEKAPTNVLDSDRPRVSVLDELDELDDDLPPAVSEISDRVERLPPTSLELKPSVSLPPLPAPTTLPLTALRAPETRSLRRLALVAVGLAGAAALMVGLLWLLRHGSGARPAPAVAANPRVPERAAAPPRPLQAERPTARPLQDERPSDVVTPLLTVDVAPLPARVFLDGTEAGPAPLERRVPPGTHQVVVVAEGFALHRETITLGRTDALMVVVLKRAALPEDLVGEAGLKVRCTTPGVYRILVDGADTGRTCPNETRIDVAPGRHALGLYAPEGDRLIDVHKRPDVPLQGRSTRIYLSY
jgi:hypothetical protein